MADPIRAGTAPLDRLQRWMLRVVTHRDGLEAGLEASRTEGLWPEGASVLSDIVPGNDRLTPEEQLHIYAYAYLARLQETLAAEVPAAEHLLCAERFAELAGDYLHDHPSSSTSLDHLGRHLAPWLEARAGADDEPWLSAAADVVRVEQGMDRAFDHPATPAVDGTALSNLPPSAWATARLRFVAGLDVLALAHDVGPAMDAAKAGRPAELPARRTSHMAVYCRDHRRYRLTVAPLAAALLQPLLEGATLGDALQDLALRPDVDLPELLGQVGPWFQQWAGAGWIAAVET